MDIRLYNKIKRLVLIKLFNRKMWMYKHTNINNIPKGLDPKLKQSKEMKKVINDLIKGNWLIVKPTHYGLEISLNIKNKKEIEEFIEGDNEN